MKETLSEYNFRRMIRRGGISGGMFFIMRATCFAFSGFDIFFVKYLIYHLSLPPAGLM